MYLEHYRNLTQLPDEFLCLTPVDAKLQGRRHAALVGGMSLSTLSRVDLSVLREFVGWRQLRLVKMNLLDSDIKAIAI